MGKRLRISDMPFDLGAEKREYVILNRVTGELEKIHFDKYLDMISKKDKDGVMVVKTGIIL